jgi:cell division transport system permease protein
VNRRVTPAPEKPGAEAPVRAPAAERHALPRVGFRRWLNLHRRAAGDAIARLLVRKLASLMGLLLIGLALALPLLLLTLSNNLNRLVTGFQSSGEIALFLQPGLDSAHAKAVAESLRARPDVAAVTLRTPADGLRELQSLPGFAEAIAAAGANPLPYLLLVSPHRESEAAALTLEFAALADVDLVQHDSQWRDRLQRMLDVMRRLALVSLVLFGLAVLLVVGNHVRVEVALRREEIGIVKLLGASDGFVRRPFLWSGFWLGLASAIVAVAITLLVRAYFAPAVQALAASYESDFVLQGPDLATMSATLVGGVLLGSIGAYLASTLQLATDRAS